MSEYCDYIEKEILDVLPSTYEDNWEVPKPELIKACWTKMFNKTLERWGWNDQTKEDLFQWGMYGYNWTELHKSEKEEKADVRKLYNWFYGEIHYIYDRMSMDRLFRCHRIYNMLIQKMKENETI